jgi:hypothetical protein
MTRARLNELIERHCGYTGAAVGDLQMGKRTRECSEARSLIIRDLTIEGVEVKQIGLWLGIHPSSVMYQQRKIFGDAVA